MKKDKLLTDFMEGIEMTILPEKDQILLSSIGGDGGCSGTTNNDCQVTNNCNGGNCVAGCGVKK